MTPEQQAEAATHDNLSSIKIIGAILSPDLVIGAHQPSDNAAKARSALYCFCVACYLMAARLCLRTAGPACMVKGTERRV